MKQVHISLRVALHKVGLENASIMVSIKMASTIQHKSELVGFYPKQFIMRSALYYFHPLPN
jgi:hypothetical protein